MRTERDNKVPQKIDTGEQVEKQQKKLVIGYALASKKKKSFFQPKLEVLAREKGISFVSIDQDRPLSEQGPFDVVLHKLLGNEWKHAIENYQQTHPEVTVLGPPGVIQRICNRQSMLQGIAEINLPDYDGMICVPNQMVVLKDIEYSAVQIAEAGLKFPLVAKPLFVDETTKSHEVLYTYDHLLRTKLEFPFILQEFVNHVVQQSSRSNISFWEKEKGSGSLVWKDFPNETDWHARLLELPPKRLVIGLVRELQSKGLLLFSIDIIRKNEIAEMFYVIDIDIFPGYEKMHGYENVFIEFLSQRKHKKSYSPQDFRFDVVPYVSNKESEEVQILDTDIMKLEQVHLDVERVVRHLPCKASLYFTHSYHSFEITSGVHKFTFDILLRL